MHQVEELNHLKKKKTVAELNLYFSHTQTQLIPPFKKKTKKKKKIKKKKKKRRRRRRRKKERKKTYQCIK
jgi:hypothetical protein